MDADCGLKLWWSILIYLQNYIYIWEDVVPCSDRWKGISLLCINNPECEVTTPQVPLICACVFLACNMGLSLGDKKCITGSGDGQGKRSMGIFALSSLKARHLCWENGDHSCLRDKEKGFVRVNTSLLSYPPAISCHNQLGLNQNTSTLTAPGKKNCSLDSGLQCDTEKKATSFCYCYFSTFP